MSALGHKRTFSQAQPMSAFQTSSGRPNADCGAVVATQTATAFGDLTNALLGINILARAL
jgi:hypothetical protein